MLRRMPKGHSKFTSVDLGGAGIPYIAGDTEVDVDQRRIACLYSVDEKVRKLYSELRSYSLSPENQWILRANSVAEKYYKKVLPVIESDRPTMDLVLENWGFPVTREKSSLGNAYRLGFILAVA